MVICHKKLFLIWWFSWITPGGFVKRFMKILNSSQKNTGSYPKIAHSRETVKKNVLV